MDIVCTNLQIVNDTFVSRAPVGDDSHFEQVTDAIRDHLSGRVLWRGRKSCQPAAMKHTRLQSPQNACLPDPDADVAGANPLTIEHVAPGIRLVHSPGKLFDRLARQSRKRRTAQRADDRGLHPDGPRARSRRVASEVRDQVEMRIAAVDCQVMRQGHGGQHQVRLRQMVTRRGQSFSREYGRLKNGTQIQVSTSTSSATAMLLLHFGRFEHAPVLFHLDAARKFLEVAAQLLEPVPRRISQVIQRSRSTFAL